MMNRLFLYGLAGTLSAFIVAQISFSQQTSSFEDIDFHAVCNPHAELKGPKQLLVRFIPMVVSSGPPEVDTKMVVDAGAYELSSNTFGYGFPSKGWMSAVFEGPAIELRLYCDTATEPKELRFSYTPNPSTKIGFSQQPSLHRSEMDVGHIGVGTSSMTLTPDRSGLGTLYSAGHRTNHPYYLQFSIPIHPPTDILTTSIVYQIF